LPLKIDLHVHTVFSGDSAITLREASKIAKVKGLHGMAITDHDSIEAHSKFPKDSNLIMIPGIEVSSADGHILALGVTQPIKKGLKSPETLEEIHEQGGVAVIPHPNSFLRRGIKSKVLRQIRPDAIETINSSALTLPIFGKINRVAREMGLPETAGSDAHIPELIGRAYTVVEIENENLESILKAIKAGKTTPMGKRMTVMDILKRLRFQVERQTRLTTNPSE